MFEAFREVGVMDGKDCLCSFEVRYEFTITAGRKARTWATASDGQFHPAEADSVEVGKVFARFHPKGKWFELEGVAVDMVLADVPDAWFIQQATEQAA